jgi:hypothetical protein
MNYVSGSLAAAFENFVSTKDVSVNVGSSAGRFVLGVATSLNGDATASRSLTAQTYNAVSLTATTAQSNTFGKFFQAVHGTTTATGSNSLSVSATNNSGGIYIGGVAFDGVDTGAPISGLVHGANDNAAPTWTVTSATGETVYALILEGGSQSTITEGSGVTVVATVNVDVSRYHLLSKAGASSVTIDGTFPGTRSWMGWAFSLRGSGGGGGSVGAGLMSSPLLVSRLRRGLVR